MSTTDGAEQYLDKNSKFSETMGIKQHTANAASLQGTTPDNFSFFQDNDSDDSLSHPDSGFDSGRSPPSSNTSFTPPPRPEEITRMQKHISMQEFGKDLQKAARCIFPNVHQSRYSNAYVLMFMWEIEDENLPVRLEIDKLRYVFEEIYHYDVEVFRIPDKRSHSKVSAKINEFVSINDDSVEDLKIVFYAGHSKLSKTKDIVWTSVQKTGDKFATVTWTGIQQELQQAQSDVLILLDCCSSGVADGGEGNGVTELLAACPFGIEANGVGPYSFTNSLTIELRLLSQKKLFSVGDLYSNMYRRNQSHLHQGVANERYPPPIHLRLRSEEKFPRSIQLSVQRQVSQLDTELGTSEHSEHMAPPRIPDKSINRQILFGTGPKTPNEPLYPRPYFEYGSMSQQSSESELTKKSVSLAPLESVDVCKKKPPSPVDGNRMLLAIRFTDTVTAKDLSSEYFADWLRTIPGEVAEVVVEAGFICDSTLLLVSLPVSLWTYLSDNPAIIPLGRVLSSNLLAPKQVILGRTDNEDDVNPQSPTKENKGKGKIVSFAEEGNQVILPRDFGYEENSIDEGLEVEADMCQDLVVDYTEEVSEESTDTEEETEDDESIEEVSTGVLVAYPGDSPSFRVSGPAIIYCLNIRDKFPLAEIQLVERLGEANWQRHVAIRSRNELEEITALEIPQETPRYVFQPKSTFEDSGLGTSLPTLLSAPSLAPHVYHTSNIESLRPRSSYAPSLLSYLSRASDPDTDHFRVPPIPREAAERKPFSCFICRRVISHVRNRLEWKLHVFTDIRPYICLFSTCTEVLSTFPTRKTWAEHQSHYHFVDISWHCQHCPAIFDSLEEFKLHLNEFHATPVSDSVVQLAEKRLPHTIGTVKCPLCLKVPGSTEASYFLHVSKHMESIALGALPREPDEPQETGPDDSDSDISRQGTSERDSYLVEAASQLTSTSPKLAGGELKRDGQDDVVLMNCPFCDYTADSEYWIMFHIETTHPAPVSDELSKFSWYKPDHEFEMSYDFNIQPPAIKTATLVALVARLTRHDMLDSMFNNTFLLTYKSFTTARELFVFLVRRFQIQPPDGMAQDEFEKWRDRKQKLIRFRVVNILKSWVDNFWMEDQSHETMSLLRDIYYFARDTVKVIGVSGANSLMILLEQRIRRNDETKVKRLILNSSQSWPAPILPRSMKIITFLDVNITEYARQLTLMEFNLLSKINTKELLSNNWNKAAVKDGLEPARNIKAFLLHDSQLSDWIIGLTLYQTTAKKKGAVIKHFVGIANKCRQLNNYSAVASIVFALGAPKIVVLNETWKLVSNDTIRILQELRGLMSFYKGYSQQYQDALHLANPPCIPCLRVHLTELARTEAAAPVIIDKSAQINFAQLQKTAEIIRDIQQYQNISYSLQPVPELQEYILVNLQAASDAGEPEPKNLEAELLSSPAGKSGRETPSYFG